MSERARISASRRWPRLNLESVFTEDASSRLSFSWDTVNFGTGDAIRAARQQNEAASSLLDAVRKDLVVRWQTSEVNYQRALERLDSARGLISSSQQVTEVFEKQFQIARRSMVDLLNAYAELSGIESATAQAASDVRAAALEYLHAGARTEAGVRGSLPAPSEPEIATLASDNARAGAAATPVQPSRPAVGPGTSPRSGKLRLQFDQQLSAPDGTVSPTVPGGAGAVSPSEDAVDPSGAMPR